jgi:hypothetical protein
MRRITAYEFACGAVQTVTIGEWRVQLYREHNVYHVRAYRARDGKQEWKSAHTLNDARLHFRVMRGLAFEDSNTPRLQSLSNSAVMAVCGPGSIGKKETR